MTPEALETAKDLIAFIDASPTPYHAVAEAARRLEADGFRRLDERDPWALSAGDRAYVVRAGGTLVAFVMGTAPPEDSGFLILGAHTDSPNFRLKPRAEQTTQTYRLLGAEVYGSVLLHTWTDRDLSLAGRVTLASGETRLFRFERPLCKIPNLAIHLNPAIAGNGLALNAQQHLVPLVGLEAETTSDLKSLLAAELSRTGAKVSGDDLFGHDLCLFDTQPGAITGASGEFVSSARLDNLASCHAALSALLASPAAKATRVIALMDHEEVGSLSAAGAQGRFLASVLERLSSARGPSAPDACHRALARSLCVSADMAHALHPNYSEKHDAQHAPRLGRGPVLKVNASQSYATDGPSAALFAQACRAAGFSPQHFVSRNDMRCGSTIGPISAARLGVRTVDVGNPMLGMHSCRETAGTADVAKMIAALTFVLSSATVPEPAA